MSVSQYIGARYVTKIYENSVTPSTAEWEANVNYEPLTLATYNYGSYLSKSEVPANIGNPADNPSYWVQTGFYNGQIANLQNQINALKSFNGSFRSKNLVVIGDSWVVGYTENTGDGFVECLDSLNLFKSITKYCKGGAGYVTQADGVDYDTLTDDLISDYSGHENDVNVILYTGSVNDLGVADATIQSACESVFAKVRTAFPDAEIYVSAGIVTSATWAQWNKMEIPLNNCSSYGIIPLYWPGRLLMGNANNFTTDGYHMNHTLSQCYANNIVNNMLGFFAFGPDPAYHIHISDVDFLTDKVTGFSYDNTYSGLIFNNEYYIIKLVSTGFTSPTGGVEPLAKVKAEYFPPSASYVAELVDSTTESRYAMDTVSGDLHTIKNRFKLENSTGNIRNPLYQSSFAGSLNAGNCTFIYDRLKRTWLSNMPLSH